MVSGDMLGMIVVSPKVGRINAMTPKFANNTIGDVFGIRNIIELNIL